jgi:chromosome segregation ATPase
MTQLASDYGRYGYRRVTALLRGEGWPGGRLNTNLNTGTCRGGRSLVERRKAVAPDVQRLGERLTRREARLESLRERKADEFTSEQHHELRDLEREIENSTERLEELSAELQQINDEFDRLEARRLVP